MLKSFLSLFTGGLVGKFLGAVREILLAALFGTSSVVAAYRVAQTATLVPVNFFTTDALNAAFLPMHARYLNADARRAEVLYRSLRAFLGAVTVVLVLGLAVGRFSWIHLLAPGFDDATAELASALLLVTALGIPFYLGFSMLSYLEMSHGSFRLASVRSTVQSCGLIAGTLGAFWLDRPTLLAWGFTGSYLFLCGWGMRRVRRLGLVTSHEPVRWGEARPVMSELWTIARPLLALPLILQGTIAVERAIATLMGTEVAASLDYARLITETGIVLLASPLALAGLSVLSRVDEQEAISRLRRIVPILLVLTIPVSTALAANSERIISLIYERGRFDQHDVAVTGRILMGLAIGFWAQITSYMLVKALNARLRNREAMRLTALSLCANLVVDLALYRVLGPVSLGLGVATGSILLFFGTCRALSILNDACRVLLRLLPGALAACIVGWAIPGGGVDALAASLTLMAVVWLANILLVGELRETSIAALRRVAPATR